MTGWQPIDTAPKDGTLVDLWGNSRDPDPKKGGILQVKALTEGRYVDCAWGSPLVMRPDSGLLAPAEPAWYAYRADLEPGAVNRLRRIWPTHWMPIPGKPT
jgi:hypothetical protein